MYGNKESFNEVWQMLIKPSIDYFLKNVPNVKCTSSVKDDIWNAYTALNEHCKNTYMHDCNGRLDRHKVVACYMFAILKAYPFSFELPLKENLIFTLNEHLAIQIGISLLRAFLVAPIDTSEEEDYPKIYPEYDLEIFENGFKFPQKENEEIYHGEYRSNFALELYFTHKENCYNILSLSHSLYLLELFNRYKRE